MPTLDEHRKNLEHYRGLMAETPDGALREFLKRLIDETEAAIEELDPDRRS